MRPHEKLKILVPRTPPDTPLPPLTPPRGPGGPKMAKMHSLKSIDDNLCQKSHFWGVKKIDLFFHSECTRSDVLEPKRNENDVDVENVDNRFKGQKMSSYEMSSDAMSVSIIITGISAHHWPSPSQFQRWI